MTKKEKTEIMNARLACGRYIAKTVWDNLSRKPDPVLLEAFARLLAKELYNPNLACATTDQLLTELKIRTESKRDIRDISTAELSLDTGVLIRNYYHCASAEDWNTKVKGSTGKTYTVRYGSKGHKNIHDVEHDYSCTCEAYRYQSGYCKHIKQVIKEKRRCGWMQFVDGGVPGLIQGELICPECGDSVVMRGWAV